MTKATKLPSPPSFPASNASYNKIVDKMHKAALNATTSTAAVAAVAAIKGHLGGVNTYAKASRRYADELIEALGGHAAGIGEPETAVEKAAAKGDPVASFMLKGAKAKKAVEKAVAKVLADPKKLEVDPSRNPGGANFGRSFSNKSNAKRALKTAALDHLQVEWEPAGDNVRPVLIVSNAKGEAYAAERGFKAKVTA